MQKTTSPSLALDPRRVAERERRPLTMYDYESQRWTSAGYYSDGTPVPDDVMVRMLRARLALAEEALATLGY